MTPEEYDAQVKQVRQKYRQEQDSIFQQRMWGMNASYLLPGLRLLGAIASLVLALATLRPVPELAVGLLGLTVWLGVVGARQITAIQRLQAKRYRMAEVGLPVVAFVVIANSALLRPGSGDAPALVLFVFEEQEGDTEFLMGLVERVNDLQGQNPQDSDLALVAQIRREEAYVRYRRRRLPASFTGGRVVYAADLYVRRSLLPYGFLEAPLLLCFAEPGDSGVLEMLPQTSNILAGGERKKISPHEANAENLPWGEPPMVQAVVANDLFHLEEMLTYGASADIATNNGDPVLVVAAMQGKEEAVDILLLHGADVNRTTASGGLSALHAAIQYGHDAIAHKLAAKGANVNALFPQTMSTPLSTAFRKNNEAIVRFLLEAGAHPDVPIVLPTESPDHQGMTPLMYSAATGQTEMLRLFIRYGGDVNASTADRMRALMQTAGNGHLEEVKMLVEAGADVHSSHPWEPYFTAIDLAEAKGHTAIVEYLHSRGARLLSERPKPPF